MQRVAMLLVLGLSLVLTACSQSSGTDSAEGTPVAISNSCHLAWSRWTAAVDADDSAFGEEATDWKGRDVLNKCSSPEEWWAAGMKYARDYLMFDATMKENLDLWCPDELSQRYDLEETVVCSQYFP